MKTHPITLLSLRIMFAMLGLEGIPPNTGADRRHPAAEARNQWEADRH